MNKVSTIFLSFLFLASVGLNVYLYTKMQRFEEAWVAQLTITSEIEGILKQSEGNTSFEGMLRLVIARFGSDSVHVVEVPNIHIDWGADAKGLKVNETLLLFKEGIYYGSKANLP